MNVVFFLFMVAMFAVLTPGVLFSFPEKASKWVVAVTHGLVFATVWTLAHKPLWRLSNQISG
jgi:hypothetical protein